MHAFCFLDNYMCYEIINECLVKYETDLKDLTSTWCKITYSQTAGTSPTPTMLLSHYIDITMSIMADTITDIYIYIYV